MTPAHGFIAARAPALRVAFSTKRKPIALPSGDQVSESIIPTRRVSRFDSPVFLDHTNTWSCPGFSASAVQSDTNASHSPFGDHFGSELPQLVAPDPVPTIFSLAGSGFETSVR